jgi:hypothetical protein
MDGGHIENGGYYPPIAEQPVVEQPQAPVVQPQSLEEKKKFPIFIVTTIVEAVVILVLVIIMIFGGKTPSIADDTSENVTVNASGKVEAIGVNCKLENGTLYLDKTNNYFLEPLNVEGTLVLGEDGVYEQLETTAENGNYTIDGNTIHFLPDDGSDYYGKYSSHKLVLNDKEYQCENYE